MYGCMDVWMYGCINAYMYSQASRSWGGNAPKKGPPLAPPHASIMHGAMRRDAFTTMQCLHA